jgi:hypothetical protein
MVWERRRPMTKYATEFIMLPELITSGGNLLTSGHSITGHVLDVDVTTLTVSMHVNRVCDWVDDGMCIIQPPTSPYVFDVTNTPVVTTPIVIPPVVPPVSALSIGMQWAIDQGIFDKGTSPTKALDANFLAWSMFRAKGKI